ncbi:MAG: sulfatase [Anaerolineae bacterium]
MPQKPNILLIILDTQRRDHLSIYGHQHETSPEFDAFAADATLFERAIAPAQWTLPSHASMFTGLYPSTHGVIQGNSQLSGLYPTLAETLQVAGYHTVAFCNNPLLGVLDNGLRRGFDYFFNYSGAAPVRPRDLTRSPLQREMATRFRRFAYGVQNRFANNDALFRISLHPLLTPVWSRYINFKGNTATSIDDAIAYLSRHQAGGAQKPMFTFVNLMGVHTPYRPPQSYLKRFAPDLDSRSYSFMSSFNADAARWPSPVDEPTPDWQRHTLDSFYDAETAYQDYHLGRLLRWLKTSGTLDNTLVIIAADHGEGHGDHNFFGHSFVVYQELVHVPLVIHYPAKFPMGKRVSSNVSTRRIFHTVLEAAGVKPPLDEADPNANIGALTLANAVNGHPDAENNIVFSEAFPINTYIHVMEHHRPALVTKLRLRSVRRGVYMGQHKLTTVGDSAESLFDVGSDPEETQDVAGQSGALVNEMQRKLAQMVTQAELQRADSDHHGEVSAEVEENLRALGYIE